MNFSLVELRSFVTVAEVGSFQEAAISLTISQPALTRRIQKIEEGLGVRLLERDTRNVSLSAVGREFLPKARRLLDEFEASILSVKEISGKLSGQINIGSVPTVANSILPSVLCRFNEKLPRIRVRIIDEVASMVLRAVLSGDADFGINLPSADEPGVEFLPLMEDSFVLACRAEHPFAKREVIEWSDLADCAFIRAGRENGNGTLVDITLTEQGITPKWSYEVQHLTTSLGLIQAGLGVTVLPSMTIRNRNFPDIVTRPIRNPALRRPIGLMKRRGAHLSPAAQALYDFLAEMRGSRVLSDPFDGGLPPGGMTGNI